MACPYIFEERICWPATKTDFEARAASTTARTCAGVTPTGFSQ